MSYKIIDSSVYVSLFLESDSRHKEALYIFQNLWETIILIPYLIYQETLTVLSNKFSTELAQGFDTLIHSDDRFILIAPEIADEIIFWRENQKQISYIDISLIHASLKYKAELITFDKEMQKLYEILLQDDA